MKMIVLVALLASAACSKKTADCDASITKGMDNFATTVKSRAPAQMQQTMLTVVGKLKTTLVGRCTQDGWSPEVGTCFETVSSQKEVQACLGKLPEDQRTKVTGEIRQVMMSSMGPRMPPGAGHPQMLNGSSGPGASGGPGAGAPGGPGGPAAAAGSDAAATGSAVVPVPAPPTPAAGSAAAGSSAK